MTEFKEWPFSIDPDSISGFIEACEDRLVRTEKDMKGFYQIDSDDDEVVYEVYEMEGPHSTNLAMTIMKPGKVGNEYYMTKGHFHENTKADEIYFCLSGKGILLLQSKEGRVKFMEMEKGVVAYVPCGWAHRTINIGKEDFVFVAVYPKDAGHDYGTIEKNGFKSIVVEKNGVLVVVPNPSQD